MLHRSMPLMDPVLNRTRRTFDDLFDMLGTETNGRNGEEGRMPQWVPPLNIWEDENALHVEAELPGLSMDQIDVTVHEQRLTISGSRGAETPAGEQKVRLLRRERQAGRFSRTIEVPIEFDPEKVEAKLEHGVLRVTLPKAETARPRRIEVRAGA